ncbi:MAG: ABC transporter ATP-binding protein/permease [Anaerolineales bacterium]|nr:ABC transporter ATP-binding protein/permease [Anaerolineales bacterium]
MRGTRRDALRRVSTAARLYGGASLRRRVSTAARLHGGASLRRRVSTTEIIMAFFESLDAEKYDRQYNDLTLVRRMARYFAPHRRAVAMVAVTFLAMAGLDAALPVIIAQAVNTLAAMPGTNTILLLFVAVLLTNSAFFAVNYLQRRTVARVTGDLIGRLRSDAFRAAIAHDLSFYDEYSSGRIVSRITSDTQEFANVTVLVADTFSQFLAVFILTFILWQTSASLTIVLWLTTLPVILIAAGYRRLARYVTRQGTRAMANVNAAIQETVSGIAVAKNFRQEATVYDEFRQVNRQSYRINVRRGFVLAAVFPTLWVVAGASTAVLVYLGGVEVARGALTAGAWYLFIQAVERFFFPFLNVASFWAQVQAGLSAAERVFALMDAEPKVKQAGSLRLEKLRGEIEFDRLNFRYTSKEVVLTDFSLHIRPGETVALVGHTGAGKSSVAKLIARFYEFQSGRLLIDGHDIRSLDLHAYRRQLGIVSQVPFLFTGTVMDNIRYASPEVSEVEIERLARQIGGGEWLEALPNGLHTEVGQRGAKLSLGQRQLVALMRVLVQRPAIFILDEATASVDPFTEEQIQQALDLLLHRSMATSTSLGTGIIIAHRLSTVKSADRIVVLRRGHIIEEGNHNALLAQGGHYAELYNTYFRHQSLEAINAFGEYRRAALAAD